MATRKRKLSKVGYATQVPEIGFVRIDTILAVYPVGRSTWWAGVKSGKYPKAIKLGPGTTVWRAEDIRALIKAAGGTSSG